MAASYMNDHVGYMGTGMWDQQQHGMMSTSSSGCGGGTRNMMRGSMGSGMMNFMPTIMSLFDNRDKIQRVITETDTGTETHTYSNDPWTAELIKVHVAEMLQALNAGIQVKNCDPLFRTLNSLHGQYDFIPKNSSDGVYVTTKAHPNVDQEKCAIDAIQAHSATVSAFLASGMSEACKSHPVPLSCSQLAS
eukprot:CAMPEP_0197297928 /NCGR_PEP_ID=MMETSP0890-20130614/42309_1 /TAXON_ID=44058 ORGANISM="Aureoumbra lagunensis, Strain CCMP1510" /NCGR_SAMPLE_ID=MMETSP0890 /ASSEMBLY_ACC=CAM_ASM_000533 /LENGTH=190 /DNA_ID=CAMNT_0042775333 /DNA_START=49 /DNA_END=621 /DNA_ORIENTATION=-